MLSYEQLVEMMLANPDVKEAYEGVHAKTKFFSSGPKETQLGFLCLEQGSFQSSVNKAAYANQAGQSLTVPVL